MAVVELQPQRPPARLAAVGWRDADGDGRWTWHSLRHVFCTTLMYVATTADVLDRARRATVLAMSVHPRTQGRGAASTRSGRPGEMIVP